MIISHHWFRKWIGAVHATSFYINQLRIHDIRNLWVMMASSNGNIFRDTGPLVGESTGHGWISPHKGQWLWALMFSLICIWTNGWTNSWDAGDFRRYRAHYDVTEMVNGAWEIWMQFWMGNFQANSSNWKIERNLNVGTRRLRPSRWNLRFLRADAKYHVNKLQEKGEEPIEQEQIIASDRQEVAAKWSRFIFWVGGLSQQAGKQSQLPSIPRGKHKQRSAPVDVGDNKSRRRECQTIGLRNMQQKHQKESQMRRRIKLSDKQGEEEGQVQKYLCLQTR